MSMLGIMPKVKDVVLVSTNKPEYKSFSGRFGIIKEVHYLHETGKVMVLLEETTETMGSLSHTFFLDDLLLVRRKGIITPFEWGTLKRILEMLPDELKASGLDSYSHDIAKIVLDKIAKNMEDIEEGKPFKKFFPNTLRNED